ncbi:MAG: amidohydrolase family protein [Candidatus Bipolaricaulota bacterium]
MEANNEQQARLAKGSGGKLIPFADCALDGPYAFSPRVVGELERAVEKLHLRGLKVHASNLKASAADPRLGPIVEAAGRLGIPILFHSHPTGKDPDFYGSSSARIYQLMHGRAQPFVVAHLGGISHMELVDGRGYVDISAALLDMAELFGVEFCERFLRRVGLKRLLFGTDYPVFPYERYFEVLDRMEFTDQEIEQIAYGNAARLLGLE